MAETFKINHMKQLGAEDVLELLDKLLQKKGVTEVTVVEKNCIVGKQVSAFSSLSLLFVIFEERLGGLTDEAVSNLSERINQMIEKYASTGIHIVSNNPISNGFIKKLNAQCKGLELVYIDRDELIKSIDDVFPDYWRHDDMNLLSYEDEFQKMVEEDTNLRKFSFSEDKYKQKLNFFIEPHLSQRYEDNKTGTLVRKRISVDGLLQSPDSLIIDGMNGSGKSTVLKRIGVRLIEENGQRSEGKKSIPVFVNSQEIFKADFQIGSLLLEKVQLLVGEGTIRELSDKYKIHLLIDSIDEFDETQQLSIVTTLEDLSKKYKAKYYIATRNAEALTLAPTKQLPIYNISRFNLEQIKNFLTSFFSNDEEKTSTLLNALRENRIIERLPITPLTLSLITILFEEKDLEIPATISDIYDNFNALIVGQAVVSSKIELIDVSFKERILSVYALHLLKRANHEPLKEDEFIQFFVKYFEEKSYTIKGGTIEDALRYLVHNTGIIFLKDKQFVQFCHNSYMEYYAAREIFNHSRGEEDKLVENFFDANWQNAAIFYAGMSKDMPDFLRKILDTVKNANQINQYFSGILGCGYIIQALYTTDNKIRKDIVLEALKMSLSALHVLKTLATDNPELYKVYKLPIMTIINFVYFYESFNSITLAAPLKLAFDELYAQFERLPQDASFQDFAAIGYSLFELAFTLDSKRINNQKPLETLLENKKLLSDPNLLLLADFSLDFLNKTSYQELHTELRKKISKTPVHKELLELPIAKLRYTPLDTIVPYKKVRLIVEGKTDARIIAHAFTVLTGGHDPYWSIRPGGPAKGKSSSEGVRKTIENGFSLVSSDEVIIGIVDHDEAGLTEFNYLNHDFEVCEKGVYKKHKDANIYIVTLPIPGEMSNYRQHDQKLNYFAIEHYFGHSYLLDKKVAVAHELIPSIVKINDGMKDKFATAICDEINPQVFINFKELFSVIDEIVGVEVRYVL